MNDYSPARYSYSCYSMLSFGRNDSNIIYNYLYISKLYIISEIERTSEINCHNCNCHTSLPYIYLLFFYQALQRHADLVVDSECVALDSEALVHLYRAEVQPQRAVGAARDGDVAASEHARVALREPGQRLDEGVV